MVDIYQLFYPVEGGSRFLSTAGIYIGIYAVTIQKAAT
jgi:hypothetical protein